MANSKNVDTKLTQLKLNTAKLVEELNKLKTSGESAGKIYEKMGGNIKALFSNIESVSSTIKKSFQQTKDQEQYLANLRAIAAEFNKVERVQSKVLTANAKEEQKVLKKQENLRNKIAARNKERTKEVGDFEQRTAKRRADVLAKIEKRKEAEAKAALKRREDVQKAWDKRRDQRQKEAAARQKRILDNIEKEEIRKFKLALDRLKRREDVQKAWDKRRSDRSKQYARSQKRILDNIEKEEVRKFNARVKRLKQEKKEQEAAEKRRDFSGGFSSQFTGRAIGGALGSLTKYLGLYKLIELAGTAFNKVVVESVKVSIDFEKELANLGAVAGATSEEVSQLSEAALDTAGSTTFTASEIVKMQVALSKLGFEASQVVTSTRSIALAAQALGTDLDKTATLIGKVVNQFGLLAEETDLVADTLVTTINNSALSLESFGTAIQYVGPLASELGFGFQETASAMAVLADNGFTASRVGTGLRGIFTELGKTTADVKNEIQELADRNLSLAEAVELVGKRNAAQLLTLVRNVEVLQEGNEAYYQQGRAIESAAKQIDTVSGQLQLLSSRYNEVQINIGNAILKTELFQKILSSLSPTVARTVAGFKAFREVGTGNFNQAVESVADGAEASFVAIQQLSNVTGPLQRDFRRLSNAIKDGGIAFDKYGNVIADQDLMNTLDPETIKRWEGYTKLLEEAKQVEIERRIAADSRSTIDSIFKESVEALNDSQKKGVDITKQANLEASKAQTLLEGYNNTLKTRKDLTNEERIELEALQSQTQLYVNKLSNLLGVQKNINDSNKEKSKQRKFTLEEYEAELKSLDDQYERLKTLNELQGDEISTGAALLVINKSKIGLYDEMIGRIDATKDSIKAEIAATDQSTEAGRKKVETHKKEIAQLDKLIKKYQEQRNELDENLGVLEKIFTQGQKDLKDAANSKDQSPDLRLDEQRAIIKRLESQLLEAAGNDEQLRQIAQAYIGSLYLNINKEEDKEGDKLAEKMIEKQRKLFEDITRYASDAAKEYNQTQLENTKNRLDSELEELKNRYETEDFLAKQQLQNNLINEDQYRRKQAELRKKELAEENKIKEEIFKAEKKADQQNVIIETVEAIASNAIQNYKSTDSVSATLLTAAGYAAITASGAAKLDAIRRRKFYPVKFEQGGLVEGPSHSEGGVPFTVQGQSGYEMEGGEFIVNKKASSLHRQLLESINNSAKPNAVSQPQKFATGGLVQNNTTINNNALESVNYLKAIAEATTSTAIQTSKPVRAFVTSSDLNKDESARRIKQNNTII